MHADLIFEQVVRDHQDMVFRTLLRLTGSREHLDDLAQDVFLRLYRALPSFRGEALITTYLYRIAVNVAQDEWKRRRRDDRSHVSLSDEASAWEERLAHPDRNAEQQIEEREKYTAGAKSLKWAALFVGESSRLLYGLSGIRNEVPIGNWMGTGRHFNRSTMVSTEW